jgi:plasmid stabilization system protein ParE
MLAENPALGQIREDVSPAGKSFRIWIVLRRFVVVYEDSQEALRIVRIVDGARDFRLCWRKSEHVAGLTALTR